MTDRKLDDPLFLAKITSLIERAERYECVSSKFLTPKEQIIAQEIISKSGMSASAFFYGGYDGSERNRLFVLPEYMALDEYTKKALDEAALDDFSAIVFCDGRIAEFILSELKKIGSDTVKTGRTEVAADFFYEPKSVLISDTVASARLDCVVAALSGLAREKAQYAVKSGSVTLDYFVADECDEPAREGSVLSIRGVGKFKILSLFDTTKKGRLRLLAKKYI